MDQTKMLTCESTFYQRQKNKCFGLWCSVQIWNTFTKFR